MAAETPRAPRQCPGDNPIKVDQKGRLRIPVTVMATLKGLGTEFYVTSENGESVQIYPMKVWNEIEKCLVRLRLHKSNSQKLLTRAKYFGQAVTMDKQRRVLIPPVLRKTAQMRGKVDVLGYPKHLEVWNHTRFLHSLSRSPITPQDQERLNNLLGA